MTDRYVVSSSLSSIFFKILDCETDEFLTHEVENKHGVLETVDMQFRNKPAAYYHAAKLNDQIDAAAPATVKRCGFHETNPITGVLAQCVSEATQTGIVALVKPDGQFTGAGVEVEVCDSHETELVAAYGARTANNGE